MMTITTPINVTSREISAALISSTGQTLAESVTLPANTTFHGLDEAVISAARSLHGGDDLARVDLLAVTPDGERAYCRVSAVDLRLALAHAPWPVVKDAPLP